jgi:putative oxidoreductase
VAGWLAPRSITGLRISLGLVLLGFGALKFVPGASPAEPLVMRTVERLTQGAVTGTGAVVSTAVVETLIGLSLITGVGLGVALVALGGALVGMMSPIVLFYDDMFPNGTPTLAAQYIIKDIILLAAWAVVAARALGARYATHDPPPTEPPARQRLRRPGW